MNRHANHWSMIALREAVFALGLLGLLFLSFAHQPLTAPAAGPEASGYSLSALDFCGEAPGGDHHQRGPCHACRVHAVDLPAAPCVAMPAFAELFSAGFVLSDAPTATTGTWSSAHPRAPPFEI